MIDIENYRPPFIQFDVEPTDNNMPNNLGSFETAKDVEKYIAEANLRVDNFAVTAIRFLDELEKRQLREDYSELLENRKPALQKELKAATRRFEDAKKELANAKEMVNATIIEIDAIAAEVKRGTKDIRLDERHTYRMPYEGKYYYFTYIDGSLKICRIEEIPAEELTDLFNSTTINEDYFNSTKTKDEQTTA